MGDLPRRAAVAVVGIPSVLALLYFGGWVLGLPLAVLAGVGAFEVYRLAEAGTARPLRWPGVFAAAGLVILAAARPTFTSVAPGALAVVLGLGGLTLLLALWWRGPGGSPLASVSITLFGALYAGMPVAFVLLLHALPGRSGWGGATPSPWMGTLAVVLPLAATWVGDSAAYFAGTAWGRRKLFPAISPKKSWVGAWAGIIGASAGAVGWLFVARSVMPDLPVGGAGVAAGMGAVLGVGAILGDLGESLLKREAGVKDSGALFPGHGGMLDRLDALAFTIPVAYLLLAVAEAVR